MTIKVCTACSQEKPTTEFYRRSGRGDSRRSKCKTCWDTMTKTYNDENREKVTRRHKLKNIRLKYGLSEDQYLAKLETQGFRCAICSEPFVGMIGPRSPCVDHNKTTGRNRDLLCRHCNFAIGLAGENVVILHRMIDYIDRHAGFNVV